MLHSADFYEQFHRFVSLAWKWLSLMFPYEILGGKLTHCWIKLIHLRMPIVFVCCVSLSEATTEDEYDKPTCLQ